MVELGRIKLANPIVASSGSLAFGRGYGWERPLFWCQAIKPSKLGAVITKTLTLNPRRGNYRLWNPWQVLWPVKHGWVNSIGLTNKGLEWFIKKEYPRVYSHNLVVSITGLRPRDIVFMARMLNSLDILAIEINLSCPNTSGGCDLQFRTERAAVLLSSVRSVSRHPIIVKIGCLLPNRRKMLIKALEYSEVDAVDLINTIPFNELYPEKNSPLRFGGGVSGPAIKQIALDQIKFYAEHSDLPIIGGGGVCSMEDVEEFLSAGAKAVSIGSAHILRPWISTKIAQNFN